MIDRDEQFRRAEELARQTWCENWPERHRERVCATGARSVAEFLQHYPAMPYHKLGDILGPVAAVQVKKLQFDEAIANGSVRDAAKELLVRTLAWDTKRGWRKGYHWESNCGSAYSHFVNDLAEQTAKPEMKEIGRSVWNALEDTNPPDGWLPKSTNDPHIRKAFEIGWPEDGETEQGSP